MSAAAKSSVPGNVPQRPDPPRPEYAFYTPTWWERRLPWLDDALAALDPEPLARRLGAVMAPARSALERVVDPLARGLDTLAKVVAAGRSAAAKALGRGLAALPLPDVVHRWLWLRPRDAGLHHVPGEQLTLWVVAASVADATDSAQSMLRRQHSVILPLSLMAAVAAHAGVMVFSPAFRIAEPVSGSEELLAIELPPDVRIPEPPRPIARPATPVIAGADIDEDITIAPTTFDDYTLTDLPEPPPARSIEDTGAPTFTPFTVAPRILNVELMEELMAQAYPTLLRNAGIGGVVVVWAFIDREGVVEDVRLAKSSGYEMLDAAGLRVAARIRTSPALNRDVTVPVWIQVPLEFTAR